MLNNQMVYIYIVYICLYITVCSLYGTVAPFFSGSIQVGEQTFFSVRVKSRLFYRKKREIELATINTHRIHGAAILYGNMDPINIPPMIPNVSIIYQHHGSVMGYEP